MTMVNSTVSSTPNRGGVSLRKTNKPLMEKRRRARINDSLTQLKSLVIHSSKKDSSQFSKLEKADILELTVKHLRGLQAQQQQHQLQQHHQHQLAAQSNSNGPTDGLVQGKYRAGFVECANEVIRYLDQSQGLNQETKSKVVSHLASCLHLVSASQNQSKIAPQPIPQQTSAPPANAAAILAAAAAAAGQLPNGQIIQIVSNPLQNVQAGSDHSILGLKSAPCSTTTIQGINLSTHTEQGVNPPPTANNTNTQSNKPISSQASSGQSAYIHYAQPLHIQIPPILSPVLIHKTQQQQQQQQQQTTKQIELRESVSQFSSSSSSSHSSSSSNQSSPPEQVHDVVSSSTSLAPSPPRVSTSPPSSLYPGHPKARAQKQLNFFAQEELKCAKFSKYVKYPITPSSSSSSSSSESENTSPLNLSQSPPFSVYNKSENRHRPYTISSVSYKNFHESQNSAFPAKSLNHHNEYFALKEGNSNNTASVIVNSRKCADFTEGKYWSMMEDERLRHQNTPSPASSVGDERLWRPW